MKRLIILLILSLVFLPLMTYAVTQNPLGRIMEEAALSGRPVERRAEGGMIYRAFPDYGKSKCQVVHGKAWKEGVLVDSKIKEVCNRDFKLVVPYVPHHIAR